MDKAADDGATPVFITSQGGHHDLVDLLVETGADKGASVERWRRAWFSSHVKNGHMDVVRPDPDSPRTDGAMPVYIASQNGHLDLVRLLIERLPARTRPGAMVPDPCQSCVHCTSEWPP